MEDVDKSASPGGFGTKIFTFEVFSRISQFSEVLLDVVHLTSNMASCGDEMETKQVFVK